MRNLLCTLEHLLNSLVASSLALAAWRGDPDRVSDAQAALPDRVAANAAAAGLRAEPQPA